MNNNSTWFSGTIGKEESKEYVRFNYAHKNILYDDRFGKAIWFETQGINTNDIDEYQKYLDDLEDTIRSTMEKCEECHLILTLTGAGYRDLVFAYGGPDMGFDTSIKNLIHANPERFNVKVQNNNFGPYKALIENIDKQDEI